MTIILGPYKVMILKLVLLKLRVKFTKFDIRRTVHRDIFL